MALQMKTECERCKSPTAHEAEAYICSYECTFCRQCAEPKGFSCPNCAGELVRRPKRMRDVS